MGVPKPILLHLRLRDTVCTCVLTVYSKFMLQFHLKTATIRCVFFPAKDRVQQLCGLTSKMDNAGPDGDLFGIVSAVISIQKLIIVRYVEFSEKTDYFSKKQEVFSQKTFSKNVMNCLSVWTGY